MKRILITGGTGFIGYHLAKHILENDNAKIDLIDNLSRGKIDKDLKSLLKNKNLKLIKKDLTDPKALYPLKEKYDDIYHLAAINGTKNFYEKPQEVLRVNILTLIYLLEWMKDKQLQAKLLFTSSNEAYAGALESFGKLKIPTPENVPLVISDSYNPRWSYAGSKLIGEQLVIHYSKSYGLKSIVVRPHNFYGPRAGHDHVIPEFFKKIQKKTDPFTIYGATDTRSFCYIDDAVKAMRLLLESDVPKLNPIETVHIGSNDETMILDLAKKMFDLTGWKPKSIKIKSSPKGSVKRRRPEIKKIKKLINWHPETSLEKGLKKTIEWYNEN